MKKIITTVGTSLITNGISSKIISENYYNSLKNQRYSEYESYSRTIEKFKKELESLIINNDTNLSAEIASIIKIVEQDPNKNFEVYLLATDTILSPLCAEYVKKWFDKYKTDIKITFEYNSNHIIEGLQINDAKEFKKTGATSLFQILDKLIEENFYQFYLLNITGGYKGVIPFLTAFGQINNIKIVYKFEDTDEIISIPQLPINVDYSLFVNFYNEFKELKNTVEEKWTIYKQIKKLSDIFDNYIEEICEDGSCLISLNTIGNYFYEKIENYYILDINTNSNFFTDKNNKRQIIEAIKELYKRLINEIENNNIDDEDSLLKHINNLTNKNDLRHGQNPMKNTYIFKSTNQNQIRIVYSFDFKKKFLKLKVYDYLIGNFNHSSYISNFKKKFSLKQEYEFITISIKK